MKRVFICGFFNFPRGSASANYVQYISMAISKAGYKPIIISNMQDGIIDFSKKHKNIFFLPYEIKGNKVIKYIRFQLGLGKIITKCIEKCNPNSDDIILVYSRNLSVVKDCLTYSKKLNMKKGIISVEWFLPKQYKYGILDYRYWLENITFKYIMPKYDFAFPISSLLKTYFEKKGVKSICLPPMADCEEYGFNIMDKNFSTRKFIFAGNGKMKEAIEPMFNALVNLTKEELEKLEFHICGIKKEKIVEIIGEKIKLIEKSLIIHSWMEYDELITLYKNMNFVFLARETSRMTLANFPSKIPEALTYGIIPVVSDVGDYTNLYLENDENSIIFKGADTFSCLEAIRKAINLDDNKVKYMSIKALNCAKIKFDYNSWSKTIHDFLQNI